MNKVNNQFLFGAIALGIVLSGCLFFSRNYIRNTKQTAVSPQPNTTVTKYDEKLLWLAHNEEYKGLQFSTEIPYPGPYCDCFDGTGGLAGISLQQVEGGFFSEWATQAHRKWLVVSGIFTPGNFFKGETWGVPAGDFYLNLTSKKVNDKFLLTDSHGKQFSAVHQYDLTISQTKLFVFQTEMTSSAFKNGIRKFVIFKRNNNVGYLSFEYDRNESLYDAVFNHMIEKFSFNLKSGPKYDEVNKLFINSSNKN